MYNNYLLLNSANGCMFSLAGNPSVDAVSQCSFVAMGSLSVPYMEHLTHKCRLAEHLKASGLTHLIPLSEVVRWVDVHQRLCAPRFPSSVGSASCSDTRFGQRRLEHV